MGGGVEGWVEEWVEGWVKNDSIVEDNICNDAAGILLILNIRLIIINDKMIN